MSVFWNLHQQNLASNAPMTSGARPTEPSARIAELEDRLDRLTLVCLAMWTLVQEETKLTEQDLIERVKRIDLMDGTADGKVTPQIAKCSKCGRPMSPRHKRCIYCGEARLVLSAFDTLT